MTTPIDPSNAVATNPAQAVEIGSEWQHRNGNKYRVLLLTNTESTRLDKYPVYVSYQNVETGSQWTRRLDDWHRSMTRTPTASPIPAAKAVTEAMVKHMVNRFLGWRLPKPWSPDNGISYARPSYAHPPADHDWPVGTNLFSADEAEAMVRYMTEGMPQADGRKSGITAAADWVRDRRYAWESENGYVEPDTGAMSFGTGPHSHAKEEYDCELCEIEDGIRALAASPDARPVEMVKQCCGPHPGGLRCDCPCHITQSPADDVAIARGEGDLPVVRQWLTASSSVRKSAADNLRDSAHDLEQDDDTAGIRADFAQANLLVRIADALEDDTLWTAAAQGADAGVPLFTPAAFANSSLVEEIERRVQSGRMTGYPTFEESPSPSPSPSPSAEAVAEPVAYDDGPVFEIGSTVEHRKSGGHYVIECVGQIEKTQTIAYGYRSKSTGMLWFRPRIEMEDGRFFKIAQPPRTDAARPVVTVDEWMKKAAVNAFYESSELPTYAERVILALEAALSASNPAYPGKGRDPPHCSSCSCGMEPK